MHTLEHALIILLMLVGVINSKVLKGFWFAVVALVLSLALVAPVVSIILPWSWIAGISVPLLFWQITPRLINARLTKTIILTDAVLWTALVVFLTLALWAIGDIELVGAFYTALWFQVQSGRW